VLFVLVNFVDKNTGNIILTHDVLDVSALLLIVKEKYDVTIFVDERELHGHFESVEFEMVVNETIEERLIVKMKIY
jgi:hypothetical protein